jgi:hypothetical protein
MHVSVKQRVIEVCDMVLYSSRLYVYINMGKKMSMQDSNPLLILADMSWMRHLKRPVLRFELWQFFRIGTILQVAPVYNSVSLSRQVAFTDVIVFFTYKAVALAHLPHYVLFNDGSKE